MITTLKAKEFNAEWLSQRFFIMHLPTQVVLPNRYTGAYEPIRLNCLYGYSLPRDQFPVKVVINSDGTVKSNFRQVAIEHQTNSGDDGHIEYGFYREFIVVYDDELPKTLDEYHKLCHEAHVYNERIRNPERQLTFNDITWDWLY